MEQVTTTQVTEANPTGLMDVADLHKRTIVIEDENELTHVIEYWLGELVPDTDLIQFVELVHRSAHVQLKKQVALTPVAAEM